MARIKKLMRPKEWSNATGEIIDSGYVLAVVDLHDDGSQEEVVCLSFEQHAGLLAEWEAGESTVVLQAALAAVLSGAELEDLADITDGQRGAIGQQIVIGEE